MPILSDMQVTLRSVPPSPVQITAWQALWSLLLSEPSRPQQVDDSGFSGEQHQVGKTTEAPGAAIPEASQTKGLLQQATQAQQPRIEVANGEEE